MVSDWLHNKIPYLRFLEPQQRQQQMQQEPCRSIAPDCSKPRKRSKSQSVQRQRNEPFDAMNVPTCTSQVMEKMNKACDQYVLDYYDDVTERCGNCEKRAAQFVGDSCRHAASHMCRYCSYALILRGLQEYKGGGILAIKCHTCLQDLTGLVKTGRRSIEQAEEELERFKEEDERKKANGGENDENATAFSNGELTISFTDYAEECVRKAKTGGAHVNRGYESSSSF